MVDMKLSDKIKIASLAFWKTKKHHMVGAIECKDADVFTVTRTYMTVETEVKVSIADMRREYKTKYYKHRRFTKPDFLAPPTHYFYFAVPGHLWQKALDVINEVYPYAGLLVYTDGRINVYSPDNIIMAKRAKRFKRKDMDRKELFEIGHQSTNTALRYIDKIIKANSLT